MSGGDDDDGEGTGEAAAPSTLDYLMHGLTILWKVLFAFVPPTGKFARYILSTATFPKENGLGSSRVGCRVKTGRLGWLLASLRLARLSYVCQARFTYAPGKLSATEDAIFSAAYLDAFLQSRCTVN